MSGASMSLKYPIRYDDVDFTNKIFLSSVMNYFADVATQQATSVGLDVDNLKKLNRAWVLCQWDIDIFRLPTYGENITVTTIPYSYKKFFAYRIFELKDENNNILVKGKSSWMCLDTERRRPIRLSYENVKCFGIKEDDDEIVEVIKPQKISNFSLEKDFIVRYTDIDTNNHVNNSKYITWALETLDLKFLEENFPVNIKILYSKEKRYGGSVYSKCEIINEKSLTKTLHGICNSENVHLCDIEITWEKNSSN